MVRHSIRIAILCAAALSIGACSGSIPVKQADPSAPPQMPGVGPNPSKIKQLVLQGCGFVPTLETIAGILTASPFVPAAGAVADAICNAVTTIPFADGPGDHLPRVNNVVVKGYFVNKRG